MERLSSRQVYEYLLRPECYVGVTRHTRKLMEQDRPVSPKSARFDRGAEYARARDTIPYWTMMHLKQRMRGRPGCMLPAEPRRRRGGRRGPNAGQVDQNDQENQQDLPGELPVDQIDAMIEAAAANANRRQARPARTKVAARAQPNRPARTKVAARAQPNRPARTKVAARAQPNRPARTKVAARAQPNRPARTKVAARAQPNRPARTKVAARAQPNRPRTKVAARAQPNRRASGGLDDNAIRGLEEIARDPAVLRNEDDDVVASVLQRALANGAERERRQQRVGRIWDQRARTKVSARSPRRNA